MSSGSSGSKGSRCGGGYFLLLSLALLYHEINLIIIEMVKVYLYIPIQ